MNIGKGNYMDSGTMASESSMIHFPAADRNKDAILGVLKKYFASSKQTEKSTLQALEIASGSGQHVTYFAKNLPNITWQPSEYDRDYLKSIDAYIRYSGVTNVLAPTFVDITQPVKDWLPSTLKLNSCDLVLSANLIHISPWQCAIGLMDAAGKLLKQGGFLFIYGPMAMHGTITPESNVSFDRSLRSKNPLWGIRDIDELEKLATQNGLKLNQVFDMPANNKTLVFEKQ